MPDEIAVVKPYYQKEEAYRMGYQRFDNNGPTVSADEFDLDGFRQSATYANTVLPRLRAMAGAVDNGPGTYTRHRQVAAIKEGCEEDEPAEAVLTESKYIFEELVEAWSHGARDGATGDTFHPDNVLV